MKHVLRLDSVPFDEIASGQKTIEVRLFDEKRQKLSIGDIIEFQKRPELKDTIQVQIIDLKQYSTYEELVSDVPLYRFGPRFHSKEERLQKGSRYSQEEQRKYGFSGITIKLL